MFRPSTNRRACVLSILALIPILVVAPARAQRPDRPATPPKGASPVNAAPQVPPRVPEGSNALALDLYGRVKGTPGNVFFSPYSLSTALAMVYGGARGETAAQMARTLHYGLPPETLHPGYRALIAQINGEPNGEPRPYALDTANALWGQRGDTLLVEFLDLTRDNYGAGLRTVDFKGAPEPSRQEINSWVEQQTRDKIKDLIGPGDISPNTSLILTNAIYFKGDWLDPFDPGQTEKEGKFTTAGGRMIKVPLMTRTGQVAYHDGGTFQHLAMPYRGGQLAMEVILPRSVDGLGALETALTPESLVLWHKKLRPARVSIALPRFRLTEQFRLSDTLRQMGLTLPFDPARADFSGINGRRDLSISEVIHKAFVDVNEKGTEAAAATAVTMMRMSAAIPAPPIPFRADHPFLFLIRDQATGTVLFLGRLAEPKP